MKFSGKWENLCSHNLLQFTKISIPITFLYIVGCFGGWAEQCGVWLVDSSLEEYQEIMLGSVIFFSVFHPLKS